MKFSQNKVKYSIFFIAIVVAILFSVYKNSYEDTSGKLDTFASCLKDKGAVFYGAFWCPHCQAEKRDFGSSKKFLSYVECSTSDMKQTQICKDKNIAAYPTWTFADGSIEKGEVSLETLAVKTGCVLPK